MLIWQPTKQVDMKKEKFKFGEWVLIDGKTEAQIIQYGAKHSGQWEVDIEGKWIMVKEERLKHLYGKQSQPTHIF
jgi:hypothetical protein